MGEAPTVVVVDDASDVRTLVRTRLERSGRLLVVAEAANGVEAIARAEEHQPDLMLLDVSMPVMDGLEALPQVVAASPGTKVVLYSGFDEHGLAERAIALGASAFIEKSVPVLEVVDRLLELGAADPAVGDPDLGGPVPAAPAAVSSTAEQRVLDDHLERFREVFEEAAIGMATMTLSGNLVRANPAMGRLLNRSAQELVGTFYGDLTDGRGDDVRRLLRDVQESPLDVVRLEHEVPGPSSRLLVLATFAPVRDSEGRPLYLFVQVQDVTAEREALEELRRSEERFRLLVEVVEDYAIFMLDPDGRIASWNAGAQRSKGYSAEEIVGRHFRVFYPPEVAARKHPEHELAMALAEGHYSEEGWRVRKDGSRFWAYVVITAVSDANGKHLGFAKVTRDITERRRLEQEREAALASLESANAELAVLNSRLQQAADDQAQFLAVTAHELRTPVGLLSGSADMLAKHWTQLTEEERSETFQAMSSGSARLRRLVDDLLTASRLQNSALSMRHDEVAVGDIVRSAVDTVRRTHRNADVHVADLPDARVVGDRDRLAQALENLVSNALRHGQPPVDVSVLVDGRMVTFRVGDRGTGVVEEMQERLFERFATGLAKGGTGLGLFIVRELARAHGGDARYVPDADAGHAFVIELPLAPSHDSPPAPLGEA